MSNNMLEGLGGPVPMDKLDFGETDPTLAACCRREVRAQCGTWQCLSWGSFHIPCILTRFLFIGRIESQEICIGTDTESS